MNKKTFIPLGDRVLIEKEKEASIKGGIIIPDTVKKEQEIGVVIAIGKGKLDKNGKVIPMPVKVGEKVLLDKYSGQEVKIDEIDYVIVKAEEIIAIVE